MKVASCLRVLGLGCQSEPSAFHFALPGGPCADCWQLLGWLLGACPSFRSAPCHFRCPCSPQCHSERSLFAITFPQCPSMKRVRELELKSSQGLSKEKWGEVTLPSWGVREWRSWLGCWIRFRLWCMWSLGSLLPCALGRTGYRELCPPICHASAVVSEPDLEWKVGSEGTHLRGGNWCGC